MITINNNSFPEHNGEALCWSIGAYDTINEQNAGYPKMRAVIAAMRDHRPELLQKERRLLVRASFDRMFGRVAAKQLRIIDGEL
jgi:hypothetical protein